jgi:adenylate kinase
MRVAVTGTPGTGKTTATALLGSEVPLTPPLSVVHLNEVIREHDLSEGVDAARDSLVADMDAVATHLDDHEATADGPGLLVESHLSHRLEADRVVVLRAHPETIETRLRERNEDDGAAAKSPESLARYARENAQSEALDVLLGEAVERHGAENVYEIDTTDRDPAAVAREIAAVVAGERDPSAGTVDFTAYLANLSDLGGAPENGGASER